MAITASDIQFRLSVNTGPGNSTAQADPNDSIGGFVATTQVTDATLHNLFDVITGDENAASDVEYRCFFVVNKHATLTWYSAVAWLQSETAGGASVAIAKDGTGVVAYDGAGAQAERIADESTAPSGESFSSPTTKGTGISLGDIGPDECIAIWVRRTAANSAALDADGVVIRVEGDTAA